MKFKQIKASDFYMSIKEKLGINQQSGLMFKNSHHNVNPVDEKPF